MKYFYTTGIVIHRINVGEADKIITLYTQEYGKFQAIAKGVRKANAKLTGFIEPYSECKFRIVKGSNLDILVGAEMKNQYIDSNIDPAKLKAAYVMLELINRLTVLGSQNEDIYRLFVESLKSLSTEISAKLIQQYFCLNFLQAIGSQPQIDIKKVSMHYYLNYDDGNITTNKPQSHYGIIDTSTIKLWRLIYSQPIGRLSGLVGMQDALKTGESLVENYLHYHFDFVAKSPKVFGY